MLKILHMDYHTMKTNIRCKTNGNARIPKLQRSKEETPIRQVPGVGFDLDSLFITSPPFLCTLWLDGEEPCMKMQKTHFDVPRP